VNLRSEIATGDVRQLHQQQYLLVRVTRCYPDGGFGIDVVPTCRLSHLSEAEKREYILADNKLAKKAGWDKELLATARSSVRVPWTVSSTSRQSAWLPSHHRKSAVPPGSRAAYGSTPPQSLPQPVARVRIIRRNFARLGMICIA
jgi:hypothetical protein